MNFLKRLLKLLLFTIQFVLIFLYIILEELIWEQFAKPIIRYIQYLKLAQKIQSILDNSNRYIVLLIFSLFLIFGELLGILSPIVLVKGFFVTSILFYIAKLLLIAVALWIFNNQQRKLRSFAWVDFLYKKIIFISLKIKSLECYKKAIKVLKTTKVYLKDKFRVISVRLKSIIRKIFPF